jgi:hypothetical protein
MPEDQNVKTAVKTRSARLYILWAIALALLLAVGLACWLVVRKRSVPDEAARFPHIHVALNSMRPAREVIELELSASAVYPSVPAQVEVYKVLHPKRDRAWAEAFAKERLNLKGPFECKELSMLLNLTNRKWELDIDKTNGSFFLRNLAPALSGKKYPTPEQTVRIAKRFLKLHNLDVSRGRFSKVVDNTKGADVMSVGVAFTLGGLDVRGAGTRIIVDVGKGSRVDEVFVAMPDTRAIGAYKIISPGEAFQALKAGKGQFMWGFKGRIEAVSLVYFSSPERQEYLLPVYVFDGVSGDSPKPDDEGFVGFVDALSPEYVLPSGKCQECPRSRGTKTR